jgi:ABC-2 type transport system ATP-binding protein
VLIINGGRIVAEGSPADLRRKVIGRTHYALEIAGDQAALPALLASVEATLVVQTTKGPDAEGFHDLTLTTTRDDELGEPLLRALTAASYRVRALNRAHPTLEDVFLAATKRSWDIVDARAKSRPGRR